MDASPFTPESLHIGARQLQVGTGWVATFAVIGYPREVGPGWLAPLLSYPGPGRRQRAHRTGRPHHRSRAAALAAGQAGIRAPPRSPNTVACTTRTSKPPPKTPTTSRRGSRGEGVVRPRPLPGGARRHRTPVGRRGRRRTLPRGESAAGCPPHHLPRPARMDHHPPARDGRHPDAPHRRHRSPLRRLPLPKPRPPQPRPGPRGSAGRGGRGGGGRCGGGCCTATTSAPPGWCTGTGSPRPCTTTTASSSPAPGRGLTWPNSNCCAACTAASTPRSSTPTTSTPASPPPSAPGSSISAVWGSGSTRSTCPCTPIPTGAAPPPKTP